MRVWDDVERRYIDITVMFSGKNLPDVGRNDNWRGSGSLSGLDQLDTHGHGTLISPEEIKGKAPGGSWSPFVAR